MTRRPRSRGVRPAEDPFLAAYLACTEDGARGRRDDRGGQKLVGWAGLRLGLGLGLRGRGLSCKSSCGAVEECVVRLAKIPGLHEDWIYVFFSFLLSNFQESKETSKTKY
jgi:hypothetical protein